MLLGARYRAQKNGTHGANNTARQFTYMGGKVLLLRPCLDPAIETCYANSRCELGYNAPWPNRPS